MAIEFDTAVLEQFKEQGLQAARRAIELTAIDVWGKIREEAPVDHGRLAGSFQLEHTGDMEWRIVSGVEYALAVHEGTGIYGPSGTPIIPVNATVLAFTVGGTPVFTRQVKGQKPNPYADRAMDKVNNRINEFIELALSQTG